VMMVMSLLVEQHGRFAQIYQTFVVVVVVV
jgi:hypothetical protein